jgi:hypothetical protein
MIKKIILSLVFVAIAGSLYCAEDFEEKKSDHFIVYYKDTDIPMEFINNVIDYAERYYDELTQKLGFTRFDYWTWEKRARIYVFPDKEAYIKSTQQPGWSGGVASYGQKTIWTYPRESGYFDSLLPHEIGHIIFREAIGAGDVPLWLEEGAAQYLEQAKRLGSEKIVLNALKDNTFVPLDKLSEIDGVALRQQTDVTLFYAEAVNVVSFLIEKFGSAGFSDFCRKLKERKPMDDALAYAYYDIRSVKDLSELWENYLKDKLKVKSKMIL